MGEESYPEFPQPSRGENQGQSLCFLLPIQYTLQYSSHALSPSSHCLINFKHELSVLSAQDGAKHWKYTEKDQAVVPAW